MTETHYASCTLCEATCGITVTTDGDRVVDIRGDENDPMSRGYICPKATALADLHHDPDRLTRPVVKRDGRFVKVGWDEAFDLVGRRLRAIRGEHGKDALGVYYGNPTAHNLGLLVFGVPLFRSLGTKNVYAATSVDQLPHMLAGLLMFGHQALLGVPDIDRTDLFVCLGANPLVSNGSIMTAPNLRKRLRAVRERGGRVVVVDPRRTETANTAEHLFIRPGTDALMLLSVVHVLFAEGLARPGRLADRMTGLTELRAVAEGFPPEKTAPVTGVAADDVRALARALATTERAVVYGRVGICTQEFGGLATWLVVVVNALTGHLDEPGGYMFTTPAIDLAPLARLAGHAGSFGTFRSRVRGLPEFGGELPVVTLAEEITTPGPGQVRALITAAGNPVLSTPNGRRLDEALDQLEFMVSIDPYVNETTRHADVILPPTGPLERSHYELLLALVSVRNWAKYSPPVFPRGEQQRHDWEICLELAVRLLGPDVPLLRAAGRLGVATLSKLGPEGIVELGLRAGPHGLLRGGLSLRKLRKHPHGVDLGPLQRRFPERLFTKGKKIHLAPKEYLGDLPRLRRRMEQWQPGELVLIGRRQLRSNNSWMHNSPRLVKGKPRCILLVHPDDAQRLGLADGEQAVLSSAVGEVHVPVKVSDEVMPGVVSLPHGWGHDRPGVRLSVASRHAGASINDVTDDKCIDELTGTAALSGQRVTVRALAATRS
ncbi:MAG: molybdopterin oxidoreductase family protein [Thermocrispum agreste]|uniref:Molybdopterin oxidoreductase family protein n=2 Tax=Thermocrispum agreste TaxID=37925 RepID=A0ABD6F9M9_9PSEU